MRRYLPVLFALLLAPGSVPGARAAECGKDTARFEGFTVQRVDIWTPIRFFPAATFGFDSIQEDLLNKKDAYYSRENLNDDVKTIRNKIRDAAAASSEKLKLIVVIPQIDCDFNAHTVRVKYRVFTNVVRTSVSDSFEQRTAEVQRPATTGAEGGTQGRFLIKPLAGYDHSLHGFGGTDLSVRAPLTLFQNLQLHTAVSSNSSTNDFAANGSWTPVRDINRNPVLQSADWTLGFHYLDLPAGDAKFKEGKLGAQFSAATRELSHLGAIVRFGASMEGGHQQTGGTNSLVAVPANSSLGALRFFVGASGRLGKQSFAGSYGIELGSTLTGGGLDFTKHVVDLGYSTRFLHVPDLGEKIPPGVHQPLDVEVRADAGLIQSQGPVPIAERFYGGNRVQNFINGTQWVIPSDALIRSIPTNRLGGSTSGGEVGGTRFYSANLTVAKALWGRPLVPPEMGRDDQFPGQLKGAISTAVGGLADAYEAKDPVFKNAAAAAAADVAAIPAAIDKLSAQLDGLPSDVTAEPAISSNVRAIRLKLSSLRRTVKEVQEDNTKITELSPQFRRLDERLQTLIGQMTAAGKADAASSLKMAKQQIDEAGEKPANDLNTPEVQQHTEEAQARAEADFSPAKKVLSAFLYELNVYSIAPVAVFDVARVWPTTTAARYGVGGGVRLSLVNVNFTVGYAANPKRSTGEGPGALFVSLDVSDLFH